MIEVLKILLSFVSGGLAGAFANEFFRRRREKVQRIQLIERVNRPVSPLEGFILVREIEAEDTLKAVTDLREYQLTMRNSTSTHLQNAQVQFEFPSDDVQAAVSVPALSRIALVPLASTSTAGKKVFQWTVPHFPAGDTVEFTFRAVAPSSDKYEYSLNYLGVVFERIVGEPPPARKSLWNSFATLVIIVGVLTLVAIFLLQAAGLIRLHDPSGEKLTPVRVGGCDLQIVSVYDIYGQHYSSPWHIKHRIFNIGIQDCSIQSKALNLDNPTIVKAGETLDREHLSKYAPDLSDAAVSIGATGTSREATSVPIYVGR
jgi:hypothetical protein